MLSSDLRLALDPVAFATDALDFVPDEWQARALRWTGKRLLLNCARQTGKSTTAAILSLHRALYYPASLVLLVSPSLRQSSELFRRVTDLLAKLDARPELIEDNRLSCTLTNASRIVSLPSSEATIRGFSGASLIVEDEAARVPDDLYRSVRPMLAVSGGRLILMSTPFGKRGHFFEEWTKGGDIWERVEVAAAQCPRISPEFLAEERASLGAWWYSQEYECQFQDSQASAFSYEVVMGAIKNEEVSTWAL
ncbi:MAG: terminase [Chloroflexi bacterium]|nr:terminase [Chloroflexota bacterium]